MADREPSTRGSAALKTRRSLVQIRDLLASSTAAKYSSGAALKRSVGTPNAALTCSTPVGDSLARGSGRRGRRFKSCHPDQYSRRPEALPLCPVVSAACTRMADSLAWLRAFVHAALQ